jgi:nucleoid-associated protein YgaU
VGDLGTLLRDGSKYQVIADASGVSNPDLIHPGQVLTIP